MLLELVPGAPELVEVVVLSPVFEVGLVVLVEVLAVLVVVVFAPVEFGAVEVVFEERDDEAPLAEE